MVQKFLKHFACCCTLFAFTKMYQSYCCCCYCCWEILCQTELDPRIKCIILFIFFILHSHFCNILTTIFFYKKNSTRRTRYILYYCTTCVRLCGKPHRHFFHLSTKVYFATKHPHNLRKIIEHMSANFGSFQK